MTFTPSAYSLQERPHEQRADEGTDPDRAAEQPAEQKDDAQKQHADGSQRHLYKTFAQSHQQGVSRSAAKSRAHIDVLSESLQQQTAEHAQDPDGERRLGRDQIQVIP